MARVCLIGCWRRGAREGREIVESGSPDRVNGEITG